MVKQSNDTFFIGERVLCYEPDPTLIKKLYSAKIVNITFDPIKNGKKPRARYWIHFIGWKKTWDWQVDRELIMKDNSENWNLKKQIDEQLHPFIQKKYHKKLMPTIALGRYADHFSAIKMKEKEKLNSEQAIDIQDIGNTVPQSLKGPAASTIRIPQISLPSPLKKILDRDYDLVNNENKIPLLSASTTTTPTFTTNDDAAHRSPHFKIHPSGAREISSPTHLRLIPSNPNGPTPHAVYILEAYLKTLYYNVKARDLLSLRRAPPAPYQSLKTTSTLARSKPINQSGMPSQESHFKPETTHQMTPSTNTSFENNFEMCKEVMDGLRFYFDCLISLRLLYANEKDLYSLSFYYPFLTTFKGEAMPPPQPPPSATQDLEGDDNKAFPSLEPPAPTQRVVGTIKTDPAIANHRTPRNAALRAYSNLLINPLRHKGKAKKAQFLPDSCEPLAPRLDQIQSGIADNLLSDSNHEPRQEEERVKVMPPPPVNLRLHQWWNQMVKSNLLRRSNNLPNPSDTLPLTTVTCLKRRGAPADPNSPKRLVNFTTHPKKAQDGSDSSEHHSIYLVLPLYLSSCKEMTQIPSLSIPHSSLNLQFASRSNAQRESSLWELTMEQPNLEATPPLANHYPLRERRGVKRLKKNPEFYSPPSPVPQFLTPLAPSKIFGFIHLLRLLAILPDILNQHNVVLLYPKVFSRQLENFLQYLSQNHQTYMQSCVYVSANLIKEELLRSQHNP